MRIEKPLFAWIGLPAVIPGPRMRYLLQTITKGAILVRITERMSDEPEKASN
ncbi:hypothetical protein [Paenibacillus hamazuiensis]|uniref:hypothetical protein n=1 Tax=Paenibacillus hamazuiensis TaxID=2936508 RepID=UPI00200EF3D9|nr:hypothetical protein [Paenibacillus hamazuiensis]